MTRVFVYEHMCVGGAGPAEAIPRAASLFPEGRAMPADASPIDMPNFPWVVKPRFGAGSQETQTIGGHVAFSTSPGHLGEKVIQPFVPGRPASVAFLIGRRQTIALQPASQDLSD